MTERTKAEKLAKYLTGLADEIDHTHYTDDVLLSAAELRRLSAVEKQRDELLEALKGMVSRYGAHSARQEDKPKTFACHHIVETCSHCKDLVADWKAYQAARATIKKAEGNT